MFLICLTMIHEAETRVDLHKPKLTTELQTFGLRPCLPRFLPWPLFFNVVSASLMSTEKCRIK